MQAYDLLMLIILAVATILGAIKGFAWQVASLASVVVSYIVAYRYRMQVAEYIDAQPPWNQFLAMLILYVSTSFVIWVGFRLISGLIDRVRLKEFDRHLGAIFGFVKGLVYCLLVTMFAVSLLGPKQQEAICQSRSGYFISKALDRGIGVLPEEIHDVVGPYLARLDEKLDHANHQHDAWGGVTTETENGDDQSWWNPDAADRLSESQQTGNLLRQSLQDLQIPDALFGEQPDRNAAPTNQAPMDGPILPPVGSSSTASPGYQSGTSFDGLPATGNRFRPAGSRAAAQPTLPPH